MKSTAVKQAGLKVTENNFGGNFINLTNRQDFGVPLQNLMVHLAITFKTYKIPTFLGTRVSKIARKPFLVSVCFVFISALRTRQILAKVKYDRSDHYRRGSFFIIEEVSNLPKIYPKTKKNNSSCKEN